MKKIFVAASMFALVMPALAEMRLEAKIWRGLQKTDVRTLSKKIDGSIGQIVELHFSFRGKDIHHLKSGWYESSVWQADPASKKKFADVRVMVAQKDLKIFKSLPTDATSTGDLI